MEWVPDVHPWLGVPSMPEAVKVNAPAVESLYLKTMDDWPEGMVGEAELSELKFIPSVVNLPVEEDDSICTIVFAVVLMGWL